MESAVVARWRMRSQLVWDSPAASAADVVAHLGASQGQDLLPASWALAQRAGFVSLADVAAQCDAGAILRTHVLRPTWHFVVPAGLRALLAATAPRIHQGNAMRYRQLGLDDAAFAAIRRALPAALAGGNHLTRAEAAAVLAAAGVPVDGQALPYALMYAELEGLVCSGVARGRQQTYALADERLPVGPVPERDEALAWLAARYYASRGPATVRDLAVWASLTLAEARRATQAAAPGLASFDDDGVTWWHAPGDPPPPNTAPRVDLVQGLDELVMSYSATRHVLEPEGPWVREPTDRVVHAALVDGRVAGRWAYRRDGRGRPARVEIAALRPWSAAEVDGIDRAVGAFARFAGGPVTWSWVDA